MSGQSTYDVSEKQRRILEHRAARRTLLRQEYLEQIGNPYKMAIGNSPSLFDLGVQRYHAMRASKPEFFRPTAKNALHPVFGFLLPTGLILWFISGSRDSKEHTYRTGQVSYRDREFKFM